MIGKTTVYVDQESAKVLEKITGHLDILLTGEKAKARQLGEEIISALGDTQRLRQELTRLDSQWQTGLAPIQELVQPLQGMLRDLSTAQTGLHTELGSAGREWNQALQAVRGTLDLLPGAFEDLRGRQETALGATQGVMNTIGVLQKGILPIRDMVQPLQGLIGELATAQAGLRNELAVAGRDWNHGLRAVRGALDLLPEAFEDLRGRQETALGATQGVLTKVGALQTALTECQLCLNQFRDLSVERAQDVSGLLRVVGDDVRLLLPSLESFAGDLRQRLEGLQSEATRVATQAHAAAGANLQTLEATALRQEEIGQVVASVLTGIHSVQTTLAEWGKLQAADQVCTQEQLNLLGAGVADLGTLTRRTLGAAEAIGTTFQELRTGVQTCLAGLDRLQETSAQIGHNLMVLLESVRAEVRDTRTALTHHEDTTAEMVNLLAGQIAALQATADKCLAQQEELFRHVRRPWWKALLG